MNKTDSVAMLRELLDEYPAPNFTAERAALTAAIAALEAQASAPGGEVTDDPVEERFMDSLLDWLWKKGHGDESPQYQAAIALMLDRRQHIAALASQPQANPHIGSSLDDFMREEGIASQPQAAGAGGDAAKACERVSEALEDALKTVRKYPESARDPMLGRWLFNNAAHIFDALALAATPAPAVVRHSCETDMLSDCPGCAADVAAPAVEREAAEGAPWLKELRDQRAHLRLAIKMMRDFGSHLVTYDHDADVTDWGAVLRRFESTFDDAFDWAERNRIRQFATAQDTGDAG